MSCGLTCVRRRRQTVDVCSDQRPGAAEETLESGGGVLQPRATLATPLWMTREQCSFSITMTDCCAIYYIIRHVFFYLKLINKN